MHTYSAGLTQARPNKVCTHSTGATKPDTLSGADMAAAVQTDKNPTI